MMSCVSFVCFRFGYRFRAISINELLNFPQCVCCLSLYLLVGLVVAGLNHIKKTFRQWWWKPNWMCDATVSVLNSICWLKKTATKHNSIWQQLIQIVARNTAVQLKCYHTISFLMTFFSLSMLSRWWLLLGSFVYFICRSLRTHPHTHSVSLGWLESHRIIYTTLAANTLHLRHSLSLSLTRSFLQPLLLGSISSSFLVVY